MRPAILALTLALFSAGAPLFAQVADGRYRVGGCTGELTDSGIEIRGNEIRFWESICRLSNPVAVRDMAGAVLYDAACSGEGTTWTRRYLLMPGFDGRLVLVGERWAQEYEYCGP